MAINYASKYSPVVDDAFSRGSVTNIAFNASYDFIGVKTVYVYSLPTAPMNNYARTGSDRYGTPTELQDTTQELTLMQDRSFSRVIDRGNIIDQMYVKKAAEFLAKQVRDVIIPEIDTYRLSVLSASAGTSDTTAATASNAYELFLNAEAALGDANVPEGGRIAYVSYDYYTKLKLDPAFSKESDIAMAGIISGSIGGVVDGIPIIRVPALRLPAKQQFIIVHPSAAVTPVKLTSFYIHENPPGVDGYRVEGRIYYDAFVLDQKTAGIYSSVAP
ncbi:MAG: N4-gp56 family major capsid protein [Peptococcaceae bacterium]|jgi:hypothetical protein|nr:N4-gp56 family major capsid protein [Peptococcaceae bacterium]